MSDYRVAAELNEEERDLGVVDVCLYDGENRQLGKIHLTDKGAIRALDAGQEPEFLPYANFVGCETETEDKDKVREIMDAIFAWLAEKGVKELSYNAANKIKEPFLNNIGFELAKENNEGFYTIYVYKRDLSGEAAASQFLSQAKQHGEDSTWGKF